MWSDFLHYPCAAVDAWVRAGHMGGRCVSLVLWFFFFFPSSLHSLPGSSPPFFIVTLSHHFPPPRSLVVPGVENASDVPPAPPPPPQLPLSYFASPTLPPTSVPRDPLPLPLTHSQFFLSMVLSLFLVIMVQITGGRAATHLSQGGNPALQIGLC